MLSTHGLIQSVILFAVLLLVPLGLRALAHKQQTHASIAGAIHGLTLPAGVLVFVSFLLPQGLAAGLLVIPWLIIGCLVAISGVLHFTSKPWQSMPQISIAFAQGYLLVGCCWLLMSRLGLTGIPPVEFSHTIVMLTAMHFHYAGFITTLFVGMVGQQLKLDTPSAKLQYGWVLLGVTAATPLIAYGITASPVLELAGALLLTSSLYVLVYLVIIKLVPTLTNEWAGRLLLIASLSLLVSMPLASYYAYNQLYHLSLINIPVMVRSHGLINAIGFGLCGLLGLNLLMSHQRKEAEYGWILYDGQCPMCNLGKTKFGQYLNTEGFTLIALQDPWVQQNVDCPEEELLREMKLLKPNGELIGGMDSYRYIASHIWWAYPLSLFWSLPIIRPISEAIYQKIADHRLNISKACKISLPDSKENP